jgi:NADPH:quinone reductase-like Zn-dependent oxidoreductase
VIGPYPQPPALAADGAGIVVAKGSRVRRFDSGTASGQLTAFRNLRIAVEKARLRVPIAAAFSSRVGAAKAHERLERGHVLGRIVLKILQVRVQEESKGSVSL